MLSLDVQKKVGNLQLNVAFQTARGVTALFGASGSGKTTTVNMIAGLLKPDRGFIALDEERLFDSDAGIDVPPHRRGIGYVFQEGRLFPHMTVRSNLDYGRRMSGKPHDPVAFEHVIELLGIGHLLDRRPGALSGGERQRIAIGRAFLTQPRLLLLDEPLASLDDERKEEIFPYLEKLRDESNIPMIYVSHSAAEIRRIASNVVHLKLGKVDFKGEVTDFAGMAGAFA